MHRNAHKLIRQFRPSSSLLRKTPIQALRTVPQAQLSKLPFQFRSIAYSSRLHKGLSPESEDPKPKVLETQDAVNASPADMTVEQYNAISDDCMDALVERLEELQEEREDVDVEYSAGVLTLNFPPIGTYVINKQPPNKQIWLSSPLSGPKRYDYVLLNEGQDSKSGTGAGDWIYLRDGSSLRSLLEGEVGVNLNMGKFEATSPNIDE